MDVKALRADFPILQDSSCIYFDNAATSQRPKQVLESVTRFYETTNANPLRGLYNWSIGATQAYEDARHSVADFLNSRRDEEIIFTRNTTEALNLVAYSYGLSHVGEGDEIVVTVMEHHSNLLPWQMVARQKKAVLKYLECSLEGGITEEQLRDAITEKTKIVAMGLVSNVLGVRNPVEKAAELAHAVGAILVVDGAQGTPHMKVDVQALGADFYADRKSVV